MWKLTLNPKAKFYLFLMPDSCLSIHYYQCGLCCWPKCYHVLSRKNAIESIRFSGLIGSKQNKQTTFLHR